MRGLTEQEIFDWLTEQALFRSNDNARRGLHRVRMACKRFLRRGTGVGLVPEKRRATDRQIVIRAFKRQGGICPDCDGEMALTGDPNASNYATLEHIIPKSRGGSEDKDNIRGAVCRRCNSRKKDEDALKYSKRTGKTLTELLSHAEPDE